MDEATTILTFVGALVQTAVGAGFSVVLGPWLMVSMDPKRAVALLLLLNVMVSAIALLGVDRSHWRAAFGPAIWMAAGVAIGVATFAHLSGSVVMVLVALMLIAASFPMASLATGKSVFAPAAIFALAGIATAWTATPGPLMALGFASAGHPTNNIRRVVQPLALLAYGVAALLNARAVFEAASILAQQPVLPIALVCGAISGLGAGVRLPSLFVLPAIRAIAAVAGTILLVRLVAA